MSPVEIKDLISKLYKLHTELYSEAYALGYMTMAYACSISYSYNDKDKEIENIKYRINEVEQELKNRKSHSPE